MTLPLLALRDEVRYVGEFGPLFVGRPRSIAAAHRARSSESEIVVAAQRNAEVDPGPDDLYRTGVSCQLVQLQEEENGAFRLMLDPKRRVRITRIVREDSLLAEVTDWPDETSSLSELLLCGHAVQRAFDAALEARGLRRKTVDLAGLGGAVNASQLVMHEVIPARAEGPGKSSWGSVIVRRRFTIGFTQY